MLDYPPKEGYEHVEFVINESFNEFMRKYPNLNYMLSGINKTPNPEIGVKFEAFTIRFHHQTLEYVAIHLE